MGNSFWPILHSTLLACDDHSHFLSARTPTTPISPFPISLFSSAATATRGSVTSPSAQANDMCGRGFCSENMKLVRQSQGLLRLRNAPTILIASLSQVPGAISKWYWSAKKWISGTSLNLKLFKHCCIITGSRVDHLDTHTMRWINVLPCKKLVDYGACTPHQQGTLVSWSANQKHEFINWKQRVGLLICASQWQWETNTKSKSSHWTRMPKKKLLLNFVCSPELSPQDCPQQQSQEKERTVYAHHWWKLPSSQIPSKTWFNNKNMRKDMSSNHWH